jgi:hypothetical protein
MTTATLERPLPGRARSDRSDSLPLHLTEAEAEALLALCSTSTLVSAEHERQVFFKLGELLRGFRH